MFSRFQTIVNKIRANKAQLPYDDHERVLKLLYDLDQRVWDVKVTAIIESSRYETLTVNELFSKLKSTEIDYQTQAKLKNPSTLTMVSSQVTAQVLWLILHRCLLSGLLWCLS
jgi:hypothetical protein